MLAAAVVLGGLVHVDAVRGMEPMVKLMTPQLLTKLPEICPTPDGMAMDSDGNILLSCPNYADQTHPAGAGQIVHSGDEPIHDRF